MTATPNIITASATGRSSGAAHQGATHSTVKSAISTLITTMSGVGSGDNSANVTTLSADYTKLLNQLSADVTLIYDSTAVKTVSPLRRILLEILKVAESNSALTP